MHPLQPEFDLPKLRRQLEEILAIVNADQHASPFKGSADESAMISVHNDDMGATALDPAIAETAISVHEDSALAAEPAAALVDERLELETACEMATSDAGQHDPRDALYDDALVVVTEFGQASPAILQMWLSIDYGRALTILNRFQAEGLISSKGKVRHKAFSLRRSLEEQTQ